MISIFQKAKMKSKWRWNAMSNQRMSPSSEYYVEIWPGNPPFHFVHNTEFDFPSVFVANDLQTFAQSNIQLIAALRVRRMSNVA